MRFAVITLSPQASVSLVISLARRVVPPENVSPPHDPVFLPDWTDMTPDQLHEIRCARGAGQ